MRMSSSSHNPSSAMSDIVSRRSKRVCLQGVEFPTSWPEWIFRARQARVDSCPSDVAVLMLSLFNKTGFLAGMLSSESREGRKNGIVEILDEDDCIATALLSCVESLLETSISSESGRKDCGVLAEFALEVLLERAKGDLDGRAVGILKSLAVVTYSANGDFEIADALGNLKDEQLKIILRLMQVAVSRAVRSRPLVSDESKPLLLMMNQIYKINKERRVIQEEEFVNVAINDKIDVDSELDKWMSISMVESLANLDEYLCTPFRKGVYSIIQFPYLLDSNSKSELLFQEMRRKRNLERNPGILFGFSFIELLNSSSSSLAMERLRLLTDEFGPYFVLRVRRNFILQDTMNELNCRQSELRKPLKVEFIGEEGVDEGGIKREFFHEVISELFNPDYGLFMLHEETGNTWFRLQSPFEYDTEDYRLAGVLVGMAVYNDVPLNLRFPICLYKKLLGQDVGFDDLVATQPDLGRGLLALLALEGDVENIICRNFSVSYESFGEQHVFELKAGGKDIPITVENRKEYVDLYTKYMLVDSIKEPFLAFKKGFISVCDGFSIKLLNANELEQVINGNPVLDFHALENATQYEGYTRDSKTIKDFWEFIHGLDYEDKKCFLQFITGTDRAPFRGLQALEFRIIRNGSEDQRLPSCHTCFYNLMLPEYSSVDILRQKLMYSIQNSLGFGLS